MAARISDAESAIMDALWTLGPLSAEQIITNVAPRQGWAPGTAKALITRLLKKGALEGRRSVAGYRYHPLVERGEYVHSESKGLVDRLFGGELAPFVAHFVESSALSADDVKRLKTLIADLPDE